MKKTFSFLLAAILLSVTMHGICYTGSNAASHLKSDGTEDGKNYIYQSNGDFSSWNTNNGFKNDNGSLYTEGNESAVAFTRCIFDLNDNSSDSIGKENYTLTYNTYFIIRWTVSDTANSDSVGSGTTKSDSPKGNSAFRFYCSAQNELYACDIETSAGSYARAVKVSPVSDATRSDLSTNQNSFAIEFSTNNPLTLTDVTVEAVNQDQCNDNKLLINGEQIDIMEISSRGIQIVDPNDTTIELNELTLSVGTNDKKLSISVNDGIPEYNTYLWEVSDSDILSIDNSESKDITLTAKSVGEATLTATYGTIHKATCTVKVTEKTDIPTITIKYTQSSCGSEQKSVEFDSLPSEQQIDVAFFDCITLNEETASGEKIKKIEQKVSNNNNNNNNNDNDNDVTIGEPENGTIPVFVHIYDYKNRTQRIPIPLKITFENSSDTLTLNLNISSGKDGKKVILADRQDNEITKDNKLYAVLHKKELAKSATEDTTEKNYELQPLHFELKVKADSQTYNAFNWYAFVKDNKGTYYNFTVEASAQTGSDNLYKLTVHPDFGSSSLPEDFNFGSFSLVCIAYKSDNSQTSYISQCQVTLVQAGDINIDGKINTADAVQLLKYQAGIVDSLTLFEAADVNYDSIINTADAVTILKYVAGITDIVMP